ncbi:aminotransferase class V-fold PLP-dependent enzyme [Clostridium formicaceticum]|uniref:Class V aminotransferase n=1 Tax=Clostridium formicaceticum TaxID=1497 RepID=A0AAC9WFZ9_9CLOT|nr:aminotransferase class V-fold PLP-dependent enzyme [Clostridium formicaceticum]AOY75933.1 class V aminotransferase [Clostridium formicaceticum]ARE86280.1 putative cysteine desulfurase [Clostridium formicaceticum]
MSYIHPFAEARKLIAGIDTKISLPNGKYTTVINFDNAATTPPFLPVLEEIMNFSPWYASVHRGTGYKSQVSSNFYENARSTIADFVGADLKHDTIIFLKNTTEAINKLSNRLLDTYKDGVILSTFMEHHSNDLPWRNKYTVDYIDIDQEGKLSLGDLESKLLYYKGKVKLVAVTGASNVTGYINPIDQIAELAHRYGAKILIDGAQLVPHASINMKSPDNSQHIDFLVFSGHKMYAPFGTGVLIGPKKFFEKGAPDYSGGGTVEIVTHDTIKWNDPPLKEEAGTPNVMGVLAIVTAIKTLKKLGMEDIEIYERKLMEYALSRLKDIDDLIFYGDAFNSKDRVSIIPFNIHNMSHSMVATILAQEGAIAVRNGCFCAQPYIQRLLNISAEEIKNRIEDPSLPHPGVVRISFGLYNSFDEIDQLIKLLSKISKNKKAYLSKYRHLSF